MRALKAFLVVMAILIVAGFVFVGVIIVRRISHPQTPPAVAERSLGLPAGSRIAEMLAVGDRLVLRVALPGGSERIIAIDPHTGTVSARIALGADGPPSQ